MRFNKNKYSALFTIIFLLFSLNAISKDGKKNLDSLIAISRSSAHDTTRANAMVDIAAQYLLYNADSCLYYVDQYTKIGKKLEASGNNLLVRKGINLQAVGILTKGNNFFYQSMLDSATLYANRAFELYKKTDSQNGMASCYNTLGNIHQTLGEYEKAEMYFKFNYNNRKKLGISKMVAAACNNLGLIAGDRGDFKMASDYYLEALRIKDSLGDLKGQSSTYNNLGLLYADQGDQKNALKFYTRSLELATEGKDKKGQAVSYHNIANVYGEQKDYEKSIEYYQKALQIRIATNDKYGEASTLGNLGSIYMQQADSAKKKNDKVMQMQYLELAEELVGRSLELRINLKDKKGIATCYNNLGLLSISRDKAEKGIEYCSQALKITQELKIPEKSKVSCQCLYQAYEAKKDFAKAFAYQKRFIALRDSLENQRAKKELLSKTLQYEYDKKSLADSLKNAEQRAIQTLNFKREKEKQDHFTWSAIIVCGLMFIVLIVTYRNYRNKQKINQTLSHQNRIIEEKNIEILDSIQYAKRIQEAILPDTQLLQDFFAESFILFKPKDIVSGDFYWVDKKDNVLFTAVVDCTGHGVPGAFISLLGYNLLNRSVSEFSKTSPGDILHCMDTQLEDLLKRSSINVKDGMDLAFCSFETVASNKIMKFSGAHNPAWIIRHKNKKPVGTLVIEADDYALYELKASRQSIGGFTEKKPYEEHHLTLEKNDMIYLFSDGYADQFGGSDGKKFKYKRLRDLLISITAKPLSEQHALLNDSIEQWRGEQSQVDDICIIGLRI